MFKYLGSNVKRKLLHYALVSEKQETSKVIDIAWENNYDEVDGRRRRKHLNQVGLRPLLVPWSREVKIEMPPLLEEKHFRTDQSLHLANPVPKPERRKV